MSIDSDIAWNILENEGLCYSIMDYFDPKEVETWGDLELSGLWLDVKPKLERIDKILRESITDDWLNE